MNRKYTLQYWLDDGWYVGRLLEIPGIFSQAETLNELTTNIKEVYEMMMEENRTLNMPVNNVLELEIAL